jgi:hypothetical protein
MIFGSVFGSNQVYALFVSGFIHVQVVNLQHYAVPVVGRYHVNDRPLPQVRNILSEYFLNHHLINVGVLRLSFLFLSEYPEVGKRFACFAVLKKRVFPFDLTHILGIFPLFQISVERCKVIHMFPSVLLPVILGIRVAVIFLSSWRASSSGDNQVALQSIQGLEHFLSRVFLGGALNY